MRRRILLFTTSLILATTLYAQDHQRIPSEKPRLVIGIVVEQMRFDYIYRFWDKFGDGGFKRLINEGTFCSNARYNYMFTQTSPGYATIMTGSNPSTHGIVSDEWYVRLKDRKVSSTWDQDANPIGGSYEDGHHSPKNLVASTFTDELSLATHFKSKIVGIGTFPEAAVFGAGHTASEAYWYDPVTGTWMSSSYYMETLPDWVKTFNEKKLADTYLDRTWEPLLPPDQYTEGLADTNKYETGLEGQNHFPYDLKAMSTISRKKRNYALLTSTPFSINLTKDFAIDAIIEDSLGMDKYTDVLQIGFASPGIISKEFGLTSVELMDAYLRLDAELAHFLSFIDDHLGKENVLVYLTSDHGISQIPAYMKDVRIPAGYFNYNQATALLISYLNIVYGHGNWIKSYDNQQIYLNRQLIEDSKIPLEEIQNTVARFLLQFTGVANTVTSTTLSEIDFTRGIFEQMQNSFNQNRSGDVMINLEPGWIEKTEYATKNNSPYNYDTHVPLIWYGWKIKRSEINEPVSMTGIAPTLSSLLRISFPNAASGKPIISLLR